MFFTTNSLAGLDYEYMSLGLCDIPAPCCVRSTGDCPELTGQFVGVRLEKAHYGCCSRNNMNEVTCRHMAHLYVFNKFFVNNAGKLTSLSSAGTDSYFFISPTDWAKLNRTQCENLSWKTCETPSFLTSQSPYDVAPPYYAATNPTSTDLAGCSDCGGKLITVPWQSVWRTVSPRFAYSIITLG